MRLVNVHITNFRCILDSGEFDIEPAKTIFVGINESGKSSLFHALQFLKPAVPFSVDFDTDVPTALTDLPDPEETTIVTGAFAIEDHDAAVIGEEFKGLTYWSNKPYSGSGYHGINNAPPRTNLAGIRDALKVLETYLREKYSGGEDTKLLEAAELAKEYADKKSNSAISVKMLNDIISLAEYVEAGENIPDAVSAAADHIRERLASNKKYNDALVYLNKNIPYFFM